MAGVCVVLFGVLLEAIWAVSRKTVWSAPRRSLTVVSSVDRRTQQLPFVGVNRRRFAELHGKADRKSA